MINRINAAELHQRVGEILAKIRYTGDRYIIERRGGPVAAVKSIEDLERLQNLGGTLPARQVEIIRLDWNERLRYAVSFLRSGGAS